MNNEKTNEKLKELLNDKNTIINQEELYYPRLVELKTNYIKKYSKNFNEKKLNLNLDIARCFLESSLERGLFSNC